MKTLRSHPTYRSLLVILFLLLLPIVAYLNATSVMAGVDEFRSPLRYNPPQSGEPLGPPLTRRVVFVLVDGLRQDVSANPDAMPFLNELRQNGAWAVMRSQAPSFSTPAYGVLFTGAWQDLSDAPSTNLDVDELWTWTQENLFTIAHRTGLKTAVSGYSWFERFIPGEALDASFYTEGEDEAADRAVVDAALPWLNDPGGYQFVMIHLDQVDHAGHHEGGGDSEGYLAAARRVDDLLREIAAPLDLAQDTLLVTADHGHLDQGGHGGPEEIVTTQPLVIAGAGVKPGRAKTASMTQVAPTVTALLMRRPPGSAQATPRYDMLALTGDQLSALIRADGEQITQLIQSVGDATGLPVYRRLDTQEALYGNTRRAWTRALDPYFYLRLAGGLIVLVLLVLVWVRRRSPLALWAGLGALLYVFLFHEMYIVVLGRTYSFSTVESANDLITATITSSIVAFLAALGVIYLAQRWLLNARVPLSWMAQEFTLFVLTVLLLPVLAFFVLNGFSSRLFLPEYWTLFLALLAFIQMMAVGLLGALLIIAGLLFARRKPAPPVLQETITSV